MSLENTNCLCCLDPSPHLVKLHSLVGGILGVEDKTYIDIIIEITNSNIGEGIEIPQKICMKCVKQLKQAYIFILQVRNVYVHYLKLSQTVKIEDVDDLPDIGKLDETLIEIPNNKPNQDDYTIPIIPLEEVEIEKPKGSELSNDKNRIEELKLEFDLDNENDAGFPSDIVDESLGDDPQCSRSYMPGSRQGVSPCPRIANLPLKCLFSADSDKDKPKELQQQKHYQDERATTSEDEPSTDDYDIMSFEPIARRCEECQKVFKDEKSLNIHKRFTHMPDEKKTPCPCTGCDFKTSRPSALKVHLRLIHGKDKFEEYFRKTKDKKFPCKLCERGYQRREDLRNHFWNKHQNPNPSQNLKAKPPKPRDEQCFLCPSCGQSYSTKKALDGHLLTHDNNRPYTCDICDKTFKNVKNLNIHRVIHSDAKPFQCSNCEKSFKRADKLKIHMKVHSEIRPYQCAHCEKSFKYRNVLKTHMHIHTGHTPFACKTCGEEFSLRTSLNNHCLKNDHEK
ncbi:uncharacterized protein LOC142241240 [Haematobia irritans]|uniref:uncharacterized protein LOC142241240 n=1 Tax=Haematobia irritans TaxID=7368 RepID=UPI003F502961